MPERRSLVDRALRAIRREAGMPDYQAYLDHRHAKHPGEPVLSRKEIFEKAGEERYRDGGSRCC